MKTTNTLYITHPSKEMVAFIEKAQAQKTAQMNEICKKYRRLINA